MPNFWKLMVVDRVQMVCAYLLLVFIKIIQLRNVRKNTL